MTDKANTDQPSAFSQLKPRQQRFVKAYIANGGNGKQAAIEAGYSGHNAKGQGWSLLRRNKGVKAALKEMAEGVQRDALYNVNTAMRELEDVMHFSKKTNNATALARAVELRMRMAGLLIERQLVQVHHRASLKEAIEAAHRRMGHEPPENPTLESLDRLPRLPARPPIDAEFAELLDLDDEEHKHAARADDSIEPQTQEQNR